MKTVYLIRHAKSDWDSPFATDHDRKLSSRGIKNAAMLRKFLRTRRIQFDVAFISTSERTRSTYKAISKIQNLVKNEIFLKELYDGGIEVYLQNLHKLPDSMDKVLIIGHNPELELLANQLLGIKTTENQSSIFTKFSTSALLAVQFQTEEWIKIPSESNGTISLFWTPQKIDKK
jgi:phosphohistidine phosphatase